MGSWHDDLMGLCQRAPSARKQGGQHIPDARNKNLRSPLVPISSDRAIGYRAIGCVEKQIVH